MGSAKPPRRLRGSTDGYAPLTVDGLRLMVHVAAAAGDVDGDGLAESLWLMPDSDGSCALLLYQINEAAGTFTERGVVGFDQGCPQPELALADLDGDRALDVLALVGDAERAPRSVRVLWNDGSGAFSAEASTPIGDPRGADIRAFSAFPALHTDEPGRRVAFVSTGGLRVAEPSAAARHVAYDLIREVQSLDEARAVVVTDPNGDGVADIVAADAHGLWLFRAALR